MNEQTPTPGDGVASYDAKSVMERLPRFTAPQVSEALEYARNEATTPTPGDVEAAAIEVGFLEWLSSPTTNRTDHLRDAYRTGYLAAFSQARESAVEECCAALCRLCRGEDGYKPARDHGGEGWLHWDITGNYQLCRADVIRRAIDAAARQKDVG